MIARPGDVGHVWGLTTSGGGLYGLGNGRMGVQDTVRRDVGSN
jgi:hypothetical protein